MLRYPGSAVSYGFAGDLLNSHADFPQPIAYQFEAMPDDPDAQVRVAVHKAIGFALRDKETPVIQQAAANALDLGGGDPISGVWKAVKPHIRFRQDYDIAADLDLSDAAYARASGQSKQDLVETFIPPAVQAQLIQMRGQGIEDCDGFTMYGACLLSALGVPVSMCTVSAERDRPRLFSHVYLVAYWNGMRIPMDLSHGPYPGWECPNLGRMREWVVSADTLRPSMLLPILIAAGVGLYLVAHG
jgi:hypothetical protein